MCSAFPRLVLVAALLLPAASPDARELRVCADPNNLPFSNDKGEGFENRIVALIATDLHVDLAYVWWAQRRGFIRNTLKAGLCDLVPGTPANMEMLRTTAPYYRSSYVFVTRADEAEIASFDDARLRDVAVGVQLVGDDGANTPPVTALGRRGIVGNVRGYPVYGDYSLPNPPARIMDALEKGEIDVAIVWGPLAGYFARVSPVALHLAPVAPTNDPFLPMAFDIAMGVRPGDEDLRAEVDGALQAHRSEIDAILAEYGVPRVEPSAPDAAILR